MSERDPHRWSRFASSAVALLALVIVVPVGLIAASRARFGSANPLAGADPPWRWGSNDVGDALAGPLANDTVIDGIIRLSLCAVWMAVAVIVVTTVVEVVHAVRHHGLSLPDVRGVGWAQPIARYIAVGLVAALPMLTSAPSLASTLGSRAATTESFADPAGAGDSTLSPAVSSVGVTGSPTAPSQAGGAVHVVAAGESIYSIAVALAGGDSGRVLEIADAIIDSNLGAPMPGGQRFTNPAYVEVGWTLQLPADLVDAGAASATAATYIVERGDTLWDIADEQLGDPTAWPEIWERNAGDDMGGGRTFDDPNLILPGWELQLAETTPTEARRRAGPVDDASVERRSRSSLDAPIPYRRERDAGRTGRLDRGDLDGFDRRLARRGTAPLTPPATHPHARRHEPVADTGSTTTTTTTVPSLADPTTDPAANAPADAPAPEAPSPIRLEHAALLGRWRLGARRGSTPSAPARRDAASPCAGTARGHRPDGTHPAHDRCRRTPAARRRRLSSGRPVADRYREPDRLGRDLTRR